MYIRSRQTRQKRTRGAAEFIIHICYVFGAFQRVWHLLWLKKAKPQMWRDLLSLSSPPKLDKYKRFSALRIVWYTFSWRALGFSRRKDCRKKISAVREEKRETKARRRRSQIKCVISFRHQSASNRWDLELNSLLLTRYTTLFLRRSLHTYESCRLKKEKRVLCFEICFVGACIRSCWRSVYVRF